MSPPKRCTRPPPTAHYFAVFSLPPPPTAHSLVGVASPSRYHQSANQRSPGVALTCPSRSVSLPRAVVFYRFIDRATAHGHTVIP
ncbi:hypothetical protein Y032_0320g2398 [Ancylostoma ceylanicum]|uniref:Uncharacterized protein n=1 Tax=Ancylostoma ceylanicum TaxID=53326 RepID=A0A016S1Z6_9BILA|nr:hypothetical protein Y032_0320g2398 [Ancylostoma ceylanicum]